MDYPDDHETTLPEVAKVRTAMKPYMDKLVEQIAKAVPEHELDSLCKRLDSLQLEIMSRTELTKEDVHSIVDNSVNKLIKMEKSKPAPKPVVQKKSLQDEILKFRPHDQDPGKAVGFYGFLHPTGAYYIVRHNIAEKKQRYYVGKGDYEKAWAKRERLKGYGLLSDQWAE